MNEKIRRRKPKTGLNEITLCWEIGGGQAGGWSCRGMKKNALVVHPSEHFHKTFPIPDCRSDLSKMVVDYIQSTKAQAAKPIRDARIAGLGPVRARIKICREEEYFSLVGIKEFWRIRDIIREAEFSVEKIPGTERSYP
jgi:hypothetical protein